MDWNRIGRMIAETGKAAGEAVTDTADKVKLKSKIFSDEGKLQEAYADIGKHMYDKYEGEMSDELLELFGRVTKLREQIEKEKAELRQVEGVTLCPACGRSNTKDSRFCKGCGAKMEEMED